MQLVERFVRNPVKVSVGVLLVALFGVISLTSMPMQLTPEVQTPTITVETRWPGASPQEVEREIVTEQEEFLKSVEGITKLSSESKDSSGTITMEFVVGTNMEEALLKVNSRLQQVPEYPEDADQPVITTANAADRPIAWFILGARRATDEELVAFQKEHPELADRVERIRKTENLGLALMRLRELAAEFPEAEAIMPAPVDVTKMRSYAEDVIEARFERVPGVSNSNVIGGLERELKVIVDPQLLAARQLTIADVRRVLRAQNEDISGGDFWEGKRRWVVRTLGQFRSPEQVEQQYLAVRDGAPVYIRDVAEVRVGYKKPDGLVRRFGTSNIAVNCLRETGANVLDVMAGLREAMDELNAGPLKAEQLQMTQVYDETEYIYSAVGLVKDNIFLGSALTMAVLMLFLHLNVRTLVFIPAIVVTALAAMELSPWFFVATLVLILTCGFWFARGALVVGLAIPTSIIGTFLLLSLMGRSLNVISLAGLAFAVGMLVDNAVVVLENIYTHYSRGETPFVATVRATREVWGAVVASTLTTIAVFLPVIFVEQQAGQLFRDIALAISSAVGLSLLISVSVIPTAAARLIDVPSENGKTRRGARGFAARVSSWIVWPLKSAARMFGSAIVKTNDVIQRSLLLQGAVVVGIVGGTVALGYALWPQIEYLPNGNRNLVIGLLLPPPGYNIDQLMEMGEQVENDLKPYWDLDPDNPVADGPYPAIGDFFFVARGRSVFLGLRAEDPTRAAELIPLIQEVGAKIPGTFAVAFQSSLFEQGLSAGRTIDVEITGPDLPHLVQVGQMIMGGRTLPDGTELQPVSAVVPGAQARPEPSLDLSNPELHVKPLLMQAAEMDMSTDDLGYTVDALVDGAYASDYYIGADKVDLVIEGREQFARRTQDVATLPIATPGGHLVPLGALADVELSSGPEQINHRERLRAITISVTPPPEIALESALASIRNEVVDPLTASGALKPGHVINLAGTADKLRDTWQALRMNVLLALLITYLLMAALYESWLYPLVIIFSVPLGAVGGLVGLVALNLYLVHRLGMPPQALDVLTMLGFVILIGTVVNNAILIVDHSLHAIREQHLTPRQAIVESVRSRVRPIFMTTLTTVLGLLPLVVSPGAGSELYRGLGAVVLGGLLISSVFTLFLVPTVFSLTMSAKGLVTRLLFGSSRPAPVEVFPEEPVGTSYD